MTSCKVTKKAKTKKNVDKGEKGGDSEREGLNLSRKIAEAGLALNEPETARNYTRSEKKRAVFVGGKIRVELGEGKQPSLRKRCSIGRFLVKLPRYRKRGPDMP